jgi:hypothetical protein
MPEFVQHCLMSIHDPKSSDGKRSLKGAAYLVASMKLYNGPSSIRADPMKGGIAAAAEKFDLQVHPDHLFLWFIDIFSDLQGKRKFWVLVNLALHLVNLAPGQSCSLASGRIFKWTPFAANGCRPSIQ